MLQTWDYMIPSFAFVSILHLPFQWWDITLLLLLLLEHNSSGPCLFVSALGLLSVIVQSKAGEHRFVPQSVSFVRVDMEEGVKQLDKMALMCLKNLLSLIKAHTHAPQRQTEQTQFSAASAEWLFLSWLQCFSSLCWKSGSGWLCGFFFFFFSTVILIDSLPHLLRKGQGGFGF